MKVRLDQIHDEPFTWQESVKLRLAELDRPELVDLSAIDFQGRIQRFDLGTSGGQGAGGRAAAARGPGDYLLRARLEYRQTLACDRCLAPIEEPVAAQLDLMIETAPPPRHQAEEVELGEDDLGVLHVEGDVLETEPLIAEQVQLNIPMKPVCRPDCQGLCPRCGADLNQGRCGCEETWVDPRWAALPALKRDA
jgi:uncharacterized protein